MLTVKHITPAKHANMFNPKARTVCALIGLLRDNNHKASDYPLTAGFTKPSPNLILQGQAQVLFAAEH